MHGAIFTLPKATRSAKKALLSQGENERSGLKGSGGAGKAKGEKTMKLIRYLALLRSPWCCSSRRRGIGARQGADKDSSVLDPDSAVQSDEVSFD